MRFKTLSGDVNWKDYGCKLVSPVQNNGDFDYYLVIDFTNMDDACGRDNEGRARYSACVLCVAPSQVTREEMDRALEGVDGLWSSLDDHGMHHDVDDLAELCRLHESAEEESRTVKFLASQKPVNAEV